MAERGHPRRWSASVAAQASPVAGVLPYDPRVHAFPVEQLGARICCHDLPGLGPPIVYLHGRHGVRVLVVPGVGHNMGRHENPAAFAAVIAEALAPQT